MGVGAGQSIARRCERTQHTCRPIRILSSAPSAREVNDELRGQTCCQPLTSEERFMPINVVISDLVSSSECELTGKTGECVRVKLDPNSPEAVIGTKELLRILRFRQTQQNKLDSIPASNSRKEPDHAQGVHRPQS